MKILVVIVLILFGSLLSYAQSVCPITTLNVDGIAGTVVWNDSTALSISKVQLKLLETSKNDSDSPVASSVTGEDGRFVFKELTKGRYILSATVFIDEKPLFEYRSVFNVRKSKAQPIRSVINLKLGLDCWRSDVSVSKK